MPALPHRVTCGGLGAVPDGTTHPFHLNSESLNPRPPLQTPRRLGLCKCGSCGSCHPCEQTKEHSWPPRPRTFQSHFLTRPGWLLSFAVSLEMEFLCNFPRDSDGYFFLHRLSLWFWHLSCPQHPGR